MRKILIAYYEILFHKYFEVGLGRYKEDGEEEHIIVIRFYMIEFAIIPFVIGFGILCNLFLIK